MILHRICTGEVGSDGAIISLDVVGNVRLGLKDEYQDILIKFRSDLNSAGAIILALDTEDLGKEDMAEYEEIKTDCKFVHEIEKGKEFCIREIWVNR